MILNKKLAACLLSATFYLLLIIQFFACQVNSTEDQGTGWLAPDETNGNKSPFTINDEVEVRGGKLYDQYCRTCHGETGQGDGAAGSGLNPKPANFHRKKIQSQSDGALFYKISTGRGPMPTFKNSLTEEQRWQLVAYIRKLPNIKDVLKPPMALRPDIKVEHVMEVDSQAVRILHHPSTGDLWYATFNGNVFQLEDLKSAHPKAKKILSTFQHGIERLQGAVFLKNSLFLCGNVSTNDNKSTKGRMVRFDFLPSQPPKMTVVFNTVDYGANKTIFDHGWNALAISPDEKFIYANSGARTDHGEVQDNGGLYPDARDNNLTSKIFRFPINAHDLLLPDDGPNWSPTGICMPKEYVMPMTLHLTRTGIFLLFPILLTMIIPRTCSGSDKIIIMDFPG